MLASICSSRLAALACVKFRSRELTALNLLPSMATVVAVSRPARPQTTMNSHDEALPSKLPGAAIAAADASPCCGCRATISQHQHGRLAPSFRRARFRFIGSYIFSFVRYRKDIDEG